MLKFLERLKNKERLVSDGAMGTMLMERCLKIGECPEAVNLSRLDVLEEIASSYLEAGADIIQTNTFGGSPLKLSSYGLTDKMEEINRNAVMAVRKAVKDKAYVSASCGPSGKLLLPYGDTEPEVVFESFKKQLKTIIEAGADIICVETQIDVEEAALAIRAAKEIAPKIPVMSTMTFNATSRGFFTTMGNSVEKAAQALAQAGADVVGSNCGNGIENIIKIAAEFKKCTRLPILVQPNAGLPKLEGGHLVYPESPEFMAEKAKELLKMGVEIIGGCCGTNPQHTKELRKVINEFIKLRH